MNSKKVLIVEDDSWLAEQYVRVLNTAGYETRVCSHSLAAVHSIDNIKPNAIVLDVLLTGTTAFTLMHELQSYADTGEIPIILCTIIESDLSLKDFEPYGVKLILDKTKMAPGDLLVALKSLL